VSDDEEFADAVLGYLKAYRLEAIYPIRLRPQHALLPASVELHEMPDGSYMMIRPETHTAKRAAVIARRKAAEKRARKAARRL
jgi:hypothetical protein